VEDGPGNCAACHEHFKKRADNYRQIFYGTPCDRCPKYALHPGPTFGLHPNNRFAIDLYYSIARQERVGTFDGAYLLGTLRAEAVWPTLEAHRDRLPTPQHRQWMFEKLMLIDRIATEKKAAREEARRAASRPPPK
jgi:hypothetical protein